jgi:mRNA-degrading endonuclease toxin of MazEF toxin-antitoxin module
MVRKIFLARIHFVDFSEEKIKPILVIQLNQFQDLIFLPLTSNLKIIGVSVEKEDLIMGSLPKSSMAVYDKIGVIHKSNLLKEIGKISDKKYHEIITKLCEFLNNQNLIEKW